MVDNSIVLAWFLPDESDGMADALLERLQAGWTMTVPALFGFELINALLVAERRGRAAIDQVVTAVDEVLALPMRFAPLPFLPLLLDLGHYHRVSAYDAAYLETALRFDLPLATLDRRLATTAGAAGIEVWRP